MIFVLLLLPLCFLVNLSVHKNLVFIFCTRMGSWVRRRLLDGSLNRVPPGFYTRMWTLLLKSQGISLTGNTMYQSITQEMTSGELKFHLRCEALINSVPDPGLRQLVVEGDFKTGFFGNEIGFCVLVNVRHNGHIFKVKKSFTNTIKNFAIILTTS